MKTGDKKLLILATTVFFALFVVRIVPMLNGYYQQKATELTRIEKRIEHYQLLLEEQSILEKREARKAEEIAQLDEWTFTGNTSTLVGSNVQRGLREAVALANVNVREMKVSDYSSLDGWLVVSQEMTFTINQSNMIMFLDILAESIPRLYVTEFSIKRNRRQFNGSLTVTAFSRISEDDGQG